MKKYNIIIQSKKLLFILYLLGDLLCDIFGYVIAFLFFIESTDKLYELVVQRDIFYILMLVGLYIIFFLVILELLHASGNELSVIVISGSTWANVLKGMMGLLFLYHGILMVFGSVIFIAVISGFTAAGGICVAVGIVIQVLFYLFLYAYLLRKGDVTQSNK